MIRYIELIIGLTIAQVYSAPPRFDPRSNSPFRDRNRENVEEYISKYISKRTSIFCFVLEFLLVFFFCFLLVASSIIYAIRVHGL